jgi:hypothetical protein
MRNEHLAAEAIQTQIAECPKLAPGSVGAVFASQESDVLPSKTLRKR